MKKDFEPARDELSPEKELTLEKNLVWIFASPRSGTTWLSSKLLSYKTQVWHEPVIGAHLGLIKEQGNKIVRRFEEQSKREHYFFSEKYKENWIYFLRKLILNRIYSQFKDINRKIIIKEPNGSMAADLIAKCLPNAKIIILLRDGRDVINSQITALSEGGYAVIVSQGNFKPLSGTRRFNTIQRNAQEWTKLIDILLETFAKHNPNLRYILRYEDLLIDTLNQVKSLYEFIGINIEEAKLAAIVSAASAEKLPNEAKGIGTTVQFAKAGVWQERFKKTEQIIIHEIIGETLKKLNYDLPQLGKEMSPGKSEEEGKKNKNKLKSRDKLPENTIILVEINQTAGTALRKAIQTKLKMAHCYGLTAQETSDFVRKTLYKNDYEGFLREFYQGGYEAIAGSNIENEKILKICAQSTRWCCFLRDPIQRVIGVYENKVKKGYDKSLKFAVENEDFGTNIMTRRLKGVNLEDFYYIGITELYEESLNIFKQLTGMKLPYVKNNIEIKERKVDQEIRTAIAERNKLDLELYEKGKSIFERKMRRGE